MKVPKFLLRTPAAVKVWMGAGAYGDVYSDKIEFTRIHMEPQKKIVKGPKGDDIITSALAIVPYDTRATVNSKLTVDDYEYTVLDITPVKGFGKSHKEVILK